MLGSLWSIIVAIVAIIIIIVLLRVLFNVLLIAPIGLDSLNANAIDLNILTMLRS
ncbi:MAG TPA: hypothetical protein VN704_02485 [Verrucomicrobiae bacterium]|nr:hypothetical protein [Verrucomicrobiae bacterium]